MGQLEADPFADDDSDDESDFDLNEYTEEEIGCVSPSFPFFQSQKRNLTFPSPPRSCRNKSVRILPGVRRIIDSLPSGRWAVATSSAKIYAHGALARAGIKRPKVTVTADDPRLTAGKPDPAPFLLAAKDLKIPIEKCVVFEDVRQHFFLPFLPFLLFLTFSPSPLFPLFAVPLWHQGWCRIRRSHHRHLHLPPRREDQHARRALHRPLPRLRPRPQEQGRFPPRHH